MKITVIYLFSGGPKSQQKQNRDVSPPSPPTVLDAAPSVVQDQHKWTIFNSTVNLPAVLNDPRLIKRESDFFTKTWGVDFYDVVEILPSHLLPDIQRHHFERYLNRTVLVNLEFICWYNLFNSTKLKIYSKKGLELKNYICLSEFYITKKFIAETHCQSVNTTKKFQ